MVCVNLVYIEFGQTLKHAATTQQTRIIQDGVVRV